MIQNNLITTTLGSAIGNFVSSLWHSLVSKVNRLFKTFSYDANRIVRSRNPIENANLEWSINYALLREIVKGCDSVPQESLQKVQFLAANYLYKNAPRPKDMQKLFSQLGSHFQENGVTDPSNTYHRSDPHKLINKAAILNQNYALQEKAPLILTDTVDYKHLLPLKFISLKSALKSFDLDKPILIDLTDRLGELIVDDAKFKPAFEAFKLKLNKKIEKYVNKKCEEDPKLDRKSIIKQIYQNITCICDLKTKEATGIKILPITKEQIGKGSDPFKEFVVATGIGVASVPFRRYLIQDFDAPNSISYNIGNSSQPLISKPIYDKSTDLLKTQTFKDFTLAVQTNRSEAGRLFGQFVTDLLTGLLENITAEKWDEIQQNPVEGQIVQIALFRIQQHLAGARLNMSDYNRFVEKIELIHAEVSTLLELFRPYPDKAFSQIYSKALTPQIPPPLQKFVKTHLGKTAVNICSAILGANPTARRTYSDGLYFEEMFLTGETNHFKTVIENGQPKSIELYFGQFNPNIEIDPNFTHYVKRDIKTDINTLLEKNLAADHLTVAVDCTIDQIPSENVRSLLEAFQQEIETGRLNFIFFESGFKFAQFGMDNYGGSPFYLINNGDPQWEKYNNIFTLSAHQTDALSDQWFCLAYDKLLPLLSQYRQLIFNNTRAVLNGMPKTFKPNVRVNTAAIDMNAAFIDIKVSGLFSRAESLVILGKLYKKLIEKKIRIHQRASFGFYHINANIISIDISEPVKTIRITLGLNSDDNGTLIEFFNELSASSDES